MAVRAVRAVEEEQHVVLAQFGNGTGAIHQLGLLEHLQRLGVDRPTLQRRIERGVAQATRCATSAK
jgi:hypothetical protein